MGYASGIVTHPSVFPCRKCGLKIRLERRPGFIKRGDPKYFPVNADDGRPHWRRCKLNQEIRDMKRQMSARRMAEKKAKLAAKAAGPVKPTEPTQREMFDAPDA